MSIQVSGLYSYPVKSLRGHAQETTRVTSWGPDRDRRWLVVGEAGQFITQRQLPKMSRIGAEYRGEGIYLWHLDYGNAEIYVPVTSAQTPCKVMVWADSCAALDAGDEAASWLSSLLGKPLRLCYMPEQTHRQVDMQFGQQGDRVSFADGFPFLLCNIASLQLFSAGLGREMDILRFRPNIVISGAEAFAEDNWQRIRIGDIEFDLVKPCARCAIPTVNLVDASREADVFTMLRKLRQRGDEVYFGQNMIHRGQGNIRLGDEVKIVS